MGGTPSAQENGYRRSAKEHCRSEGGPQQAGAADQGPLTSFGLGEISRSEYRAVKAAAIQKRDAAAKQLAEWEAKLENTGEDGELQNQFVVRFRPYVEADMKEITQEILSDLLSGIRVYPGGRLEIIWNYRDEYKKMMLDLEGG